MTTKEIKTTLLAGDWIVDKVFEKYTSAEFYKKFVDGGKKFSDELVDEYRSVYMDGPEGLVTQDEFFEFVYSLNDEYSSLYETPLFIVTLAYVTPFIAPKFLTID